jgi:hypothetical protein
VKCPLCGFEVRVANFRFELGVVEVAGMMEVGFWSAAGTPAGEIIATLRALMTPFQKASLLRRV